MSLCSAPLLLAILLTGCGYVGEPLPPALNIPAAVTDLRAVERGDKIVVEFTVSDQTTEGLVMRQLGGVELRVGPNPGAPFDTERWAAAARPLAIAAGKPGSLRQEIAVRDWIGQDVILGVRTSHPKGRHSAWSNLVALSVVAPLAPPSDFQALAVAAGVRLTWRSPTPVRVYRREESPPPNPPQDVLLARVEASEYVDTTTAYGKTYQYSAQAVRNAGEKDAESEPAPLVSITPIDVFPPAPPARLQAQAGVASIELSWDPNSESDLAAYRLYRSDGGGPFEKIADAVEIPAYGDRRIESNKKYSYAVSAVDRLGNESARSAPVEVSTPPI